MIVAGVDRAGIATPGWKVVGAAVRGPSHDLNGQPCQDAFAFAVAGDWLAAAVCDGAGSAARSREGASALSRRVVEALAAAAGDGGDGLLDRLETLVTDAVSAVRLDLAGEGKGEDEDEDERLRPFHATLVGVLAGPDGGTFFQIGDGAAATAGDNPDTPWSGGAVSKPENGEYANETYFFTLPDWRGHLRLTPFPATERLVLMSDGASAFAMLKDCEGPDLRFLGPVDRYLDQVEPEQGARALAATLADPRAQAVSSDDKTLLWASRVP